MFGSEVSQDERYFDYNSANQRSDCTTSPVKMKSFMNEISE